MRSEFENLPEISEILDRNGGGYYRELTNDYHHNYPYFEKFLNGAWLAYQHQQSKVDELQKQRDSFIKAYEIEMDESVELKKRLDAALQLVNEMKGKRYPFSAYADQLEQVLKGGGE